MLPILQRRVDDCFDVDGAASDEIEIRGDATKVKWIGRRMTRGRITIAGKSDSTRLRALPRQPMGAVSLA